MPAAVSENGLLQLNAGAGMVDFAIDEKTGNLVGSGSVYKKPNSQREFYAQDKIKDVMCKDKA